MTRAASIQDDEISVTDVLRLSSIIELHPKQPDVIPKAADRGAVDAELEVEGLEGIGPIGGGEILEGRGDVEEAGGPPAG